MKVKLTSPVRSISGKIGKSDLILVQRGNVQYARSHSPKADPRTKGQVATRTFLVTATRAWGTLTQPQRDAWDAFARKYYTETGPNGLPQTMNGYNLYTKVQYYRQALEIGLMGDAPSQAPPRKPLALYQRIAADESEFRFQLDHRETKVAAGRVLFEITGPMPSPGRKPRPCDLRMIRDIGPKSFLPLAAKEDIYVIANARFQIGEGKRYGVRARILTGEGVPSLPVSGDFFKETGWVPRDNGSGPEAEQGELF